MKEIVFRKEEPLFVRKFAVLTRTPNGGVARLFGANEDHAREILAVQNGYVHAKGPVGIREVATCTNGAKLYAFEGSGNVYDAIIAPVSVDVHARNHFLIGYWQDIKTAGIEVVENLRAAADVASRRLGEITIVYDETRDIRSVYRPGKPAVVATITGFITDPVRFSRR